MTFERIKKIIKYLQWGRIPGWLSGLAPAFGPGRDPGVLGLSPTSDSLHGACSSLCLCLSLSLCVTIINKLKIKKLCLYYTVVYQVCNSIISITTMYMSFKNILLRGSLGGSAVQHLPLAQGAILESRDSRIMSRIGLLAWSLLLSPPVPLPLSLQVYHE